MKQHRNAILLGIGIPLILAVLWLIGSFDVLELGVQNALFTLRGNKPASAPVVIVAIDDESLNGWMSTEGHLQTMPDRWTWPRTVWATAVDHLKEAGARVIAFDMVFSESSRIHPEQDWAFGDACKRAGNVVLGIRFANVVTKYGAGRHMETLIPSLADAAADSGVAHVLAEKDNSLRRMPMRDFKEAEIPGLDLAVLREYLWKKPLPFRNLSDQSAIAIGNRVIPLENDVFLPVNFIGGPGSFPTFPFHHVYYKTMDMSVFKDKIVYIGSTTDILHDNYIAPFSTDRPDMPGVEIHANTLDTIFSGDYLHRLSDRLGAVIVLVLGLLASALTFRSKRLMTSIVALVAALAACLAAGILLFLRMRWQVPVIAPAVSIFASWAVMTAYRTFQEERKARDIRRQFTRYVSKSIVDEILKDPSKIALGGQTKEVTILFSDVRGFTAMSERLTAVQVVEALNDYLTAMVDIVINNGGTLDKYVGDAIMAVWGSPLPDPDHRRKAVKTAVEMMVKLQELRARWVAEGRPNFDIGIGLNSGHVVAGNMGHLHYKMDYTVIGDDVNLAARLESANKEMKSHILISGQTYQGCADLVEVVAHEPIKVKGKEKPIEIYEVIGWKGQGRADWAVPLGQTDHAPAS